MSLTSFEFLLFFAALLLMRGGVRTGNGEKWLLLVASVCFYLSWNVPCVLVLLFSVLVSFAIGRKLPITNNPTHRKWWLRAGIATNVGLLVFFKYTNFLLENVSLGLGSLGWHVGLLHYDVILPPAISYFTFASISYVIDVYYERLLPCQGLRDYSLFIAFFPKLLSGPIVRAKEFLPQLQQRARPSTADIEIGLVQFLIGAAKKLVIADQIALHINLIFSAPAQYDGFTLFQGLMGFAVQLYCDFSGYSDMAIGCARILGFGFTENFQMPFSSTSITEFWRRWHISLSTWLRDYLFLPFIYWFLRKYRRFTFLNLNEEYWGYLASTMTTMLLCGLWHGAGWTFVIFGGIHGAALCAHRAWIIWKPLAAWTKRRGYKQVWNLISRGLTLGVVLLSFLFFKASSISYALSHLSRMLTWSHDGTRLSSPYILPAVVAVVLVHLIVPKDRNWAQDIQHMPAPVRLVTYSGVIMLLVFLSATDAAPFIYFQF